MKSHKPISIIAIIVVLGGILGALANLTQILSFFGVNKENSDSTSFYPAIRSNKEEKSELAIADPLNSTYSIKTINYVINKDVKAYASTSYQTYAVDVDDNVLYYIDKVSGSDDYCIYKYDLSTEEISLVIELPYSSDIFPIALTYNQYDNNVYCFAGYKSNKFGFFDVNVREMHIIKNLLDSSNILNNSAFQSFYFTEPNKISLVSGQKNAYKYDITNDTYTHGYIDQSAGIQIPFIHNEDYYWLYTENDCIELFHTLIHSYPESDDVCNSKRYTISGNNILSTIYDNEIYLMSNDYSIYKLDIDKFIEDYEKNSQQDSDLIIQSEETNTDAFELYLLGENIKQTGINNLNQIQNFALTPDGNVIVFDIFDSCYKIIEKQN